MNQFDLQNFVLLRALKVFQKFEGKARCLTLSASSLTHCSTVQYSYLDLATTNLEQYTIKIIVE